MIHLYQEHERWVRPGPARGAGQSAGGGAERRQAGQGRTRGQRDGVPRVAHHGLHGGPLRVHPVRQSEI